MIMRDMRSYNYFTFGELNAYGQPQLSKSPLGTVKMSINIINQSINDSVLYKDASYIGLTLDEINDKYVIQYGDTKLKVLYVNPRGRYKAVYLKAYD